MRRVQVAVACADHRLGGMVLLMMLNVIHRLRLLLLVVVVVSSWGKRSGGLWSGGAVRLQAAWVEDQVRIRRDVVV